MADASISNGFPLIEITAAHTDVTDQATLDSWATNLLASSRFNWATWACNVEATEEMWQMWPGDWVTLRLAGDPWIPDGDYSLRITSMAGALGDHTIQLQFAPVEDSR
jgi:hypothetical protein